MDSGTPSDVEPPSSLDFGTPESEGERVEPGFTEAEPFEKDAPTRDADAPGDPAPAPLVRHLDPPAQPIRPGRSARVERGDVAGHGEALVEPGIYEADQRFQGLARQWSAHVEEALALFADRTGLGFAEGPPVRVVLTPLRDETLPHRVGTRVVEGRRQAIVYVNAEPLVAKRARVDGTIARGLAEAVFELVALRHDPVPRWVVAFAGSVAAGDLAPQLFVMHREAVLGRKGVVRVSKDDPTAAVATGTALHALLRDRRALAKAGEILTFAAGGDDPEWVVTRLLQEPDGTWIGAARNALLERLRAMDRAPWDRLLEAEKAAAELGRAGLEAALAPPLAEVIRGEAKVRLARAAIEEGDWSGARQILGTLTPEEFTALRDPSAALAIGVEVESRPDGDGEVARRRMQRLDLDHPQSEARRILRVQYPLLGSAETPQAWALQMRERIAREGVDALEIETVERVLRVFLLDHRPGAAAHLVDRIGARAEAPELESVIALVNEAQAEPTEAAEAANRVRLAAWRRDPNERTWRDIRDGGRAAWRPTWEVLRQAAPDERAPLIRLLVALSGPSDAGRALASVWQRAPHLAGRDLEAMASIVEAHVLRRTLSFQAPRILTRAAVEQLWRDLALGIDARWLDANPLILKQLRASSYVTRRAAFDAVVQAGHVTPALVGRMTRDPSGLLRAEAVRVGGREGFAALSREALRDPSPRVRAAAVRAVARAEDPQARTLILQRFETDPAPEVRVAGAEMLLELSPSDPVVLDRIVATQALAEVQVRDAVAARLVDHDDVPLGFALARAVRRQLAVPKPDMPVIARYIVLFQRVSDTDVGFVPGASKEEVAKIAQAMHDWSRRLQTARADDAPLHVPPGR